MANNKRRHVSKAWLAVYFLLCNATQAQPTTSSNKVTEITSLAELSGSKTAAVPSPTLATSKMETSTKKEHDANAWPPLSCSSRAATGLGHTQYEYRDAAIQSINDFCSAHVGQVLKLNKPGSSALKPPFFAEYARGCKGGSGTYPLDKDTCVSSLTQTVDGCDKETTMYKHGGQFTDFDKCATFFFDPGGYDLFSCWPENKHKGFVNSTQQESHVTVTPEVAQDAIDQFCSRNGTNQQYTLDPNNIPKNVKDDPCTQTGMASCGYHYTNNGLRVNSGTGDIYIRMNAQFHDPPHNGYNGYDACARRQKYEIHGERCRQQLSKVIGIEPKGMCVSKKDPKKLDLGSFIESGDKGCVLWNMWAVKKTS